MEIDNWNYYDNGDNMVIVNNFFNENLDEFQCNVYRANKKDIKKNISVHNVMKLIEEIE